MTILGRTLGIDLGSRRIGIATSDARGSLASPLLVLPRSASPETDHRKILQIAAEEEVVAIVVGRPLDLRGHNKLAAQGVEDEVAQLAKTTELPVHSWDERMTTAMASRMMTNAGIKAKDQRNQIDKFAAALILQGWLDARRDEKRGNPRLDR